MHSGAALHHIAQLYSHELMYHAAMIISRVGVPVMRLLTAGAALADVLPGQWWVEVCQYSILPQLRQCPVAVSFS